MYTKSYKLQLLKVPDSVHRRPKFKALLSHNIHWLILRAPDSASHSPTYLSSDKNQMRAIIPNATLSSSQEEWTKCVKYISNEKNKNSLCFCDF